MEEQLAAVRHKQGLHLGKMKAMGFDLRANANLISLTDEVVKSSAIEGERLEANEVRSSIAHHLGLDAGGTIKVSRKVEGVVDDVDRISARLVKALVRGGKPSSSTRKAA